MRFGRHDGNFILTDPVCDISGNKQSSVISFHLNSCQLTMNIVFLSYFIQPHVFSPGYIHGSMLLYCMPSIDSFNRNSPDVDELNFIEL